MVVEGNEILNGWPLGLIGNMNSTTIRSAVTASQPIVVAPPPQPYNSGIRRRSSSFSSLSSSNLDTESTASFFPDQSMTLGRLIGIGPVKKANSYCKPHEPDQIMSPNNNSQGICVPLLHNVILKMSRTGSSSRH